MLLEGFTGNRKQSETFEDFYDQLENESESPPTDQIHDKPRIEKNMQLDDLVASGNI